MPQHRDLACVVAHSFWRLSLPLARSERMMWDSVRGKYHFVDRDSMLCRSNMGVLLPFVFSSVSRCYLNQNRHSFSFVLRKTRP